MIKQSVLININTSILLMISWAILVINSQCTHGHSRKPKVEGHASEHLGFLVLV